MKFPQSLAIFFVLLFILMSKATVSFGNETTFVIESAWNVATNEWLINTPYAQGLNLKFPDEIRADTEWVGATMTNGNVIGTIIAFPVERGSINKLSGWQGTMFRINMRFNSIIASSFPNGFQMFERHSPHGLFDADSILCLVSPELSEGDIDALQLGDCWLNLKRKSHFGFVQYYPERTLLPTLPPEQEDESEFIKKVRNRSADDYEDGHYVGTSESHFVGLQIVDQEYKIFWEEQNIEGISIVEDRVSPPFPLGGFIEPDALVNVVFRVPTGKNIDNVTLAIRVGTVVIPPEERENDRKRSFTFSLVVCSKLTEEDGYYMIKDGNVGVYYTVPCHTLVFF